MSIMKTILVAVDFSDVTDAVIEAAYDEAMASRGVLKFIHVCAPEPEFVGYGSTPVYNVNVRDKEMLQETKKLEALVRRVEERGVEASSLLVEGPIVDTLLSEIEENDYDMIVTGSHGHGALFNLVVGSVTSALLHHAKVPVLVVPTKKS